MQWRQSCQRSCWRTSANGTQRTWSPTLRCRPMMHRPVSPHHPATVARRSFHVRNMRVVGDDHTFCVFSATGAFPYRGVTLDDGYGARRGQEPWSADGGQAHSRAPLVGSGMRRSVTAGDLPSGSQKPQAYGSLRSVGGRVGHSASRIPPRTRRAREPPSAHPSLPAATLLLLLLLLVPSPQVHAVGWAAPHARRGSQHGRGSGRAWKGAQRRGRQLRARRHLGSWGRSWC